VGGEGGGARAEPSHCSRTNASSWCASSGPNAYWGLRACEGACCVSPSVCVCLSVCAFELTVGRTPQFQPRRPPQWRTLQLHSGKVQAAGDGPAAAHSGTHTYAYAHHTHLRGSCTAARCRQQVTALPLPTVAHTHAYAHPHAHAHTHTQTHTSAAAAWRQGAGSR